MPNSGLARLELIIFTTRPEPEFDGSYPTLWRHYPIGPIPEKFRLVAGSSGLLMKQRYVFVVRTCFLPRKVTGSNPAINIEETKI